MTKAWMGVCPYYGPSIWNVAEKYKEYAPEDEIEWVDDWLEADICIDHLIGTPDRLNLVHPNERQFSEDVKARLEMAKLGVIKVAYVMHCSIVCDEFYRTAFEEAVANTGFLNASEIMGEDVSNWIRVGWGVDTADFLLPDRKKDPEYLIYTWGASQDPEEEYIKTIYEAVKEAGGKMLHSGADYKFDDGKHYVYVKPAQTKREVAERYNQCWFANAMRREDGFELANVEAPLSNAWAITLNKPCYTHFFKEMGSFFIDEDADMKACLVEIFGRNWTMDSKLWVGGKSEARLFHKLTPLDKRKIIEKFNWRDAVTPFWKRVMDNVSE